MAAEDLIPLRKRSEMTGAELERAEKIWSNSGKAKTPKKTLAAKRRGLKWINDANAEKKWEAVLTKLERLEVPADKIVELFIEMLNLDTITAETKVQLIINSVKDEHLDEYNETNLSYGDYGEY